MKIWIAASYFRSGEDDSVYIIFTEEPSWNKEGNFWDAETYFTVCGKGLQKALRLKTLPAFDPAELFEIKLGKPYHTTTWLPA